MKRKDIMVINPGSSRSFVTARTPSGYPFKKRSPLLDGNVSRVGSVKIVRGEHLLLHLLYSNGPMRWTTVRESLGHFNEKTLRNMVRRINSKFRNAGYSENAVEVDVIARGNNRRNFLRLNPDIFNVEHGDVREYMPIERIYPQKGRVLVMKVIRRQPFHTLDELAHMAGLPVRTARNILDSTRDLAGKYAIRNSYRTTRSTPVLYYPEDLPKDDIRFKAAFLGTPLLPGNSPGTYLDLLTFIHGRQRVTRANVMKRFGISNARMAMLIDKMPIRAAELNVKMPIVSEPVPGTKRVAYRLSEDFVMPDAHPEEDGKGNGKVNGKRKNGRHPLAYTKRNSGGEIGPYSLAFFTQHDAGIITDIVRNPGITIKRLSQMSGRSPASMSTTIKKLQRILGGIGAPALNEEFENLGNGFKRKRLSVTAEFIGFFNVPTYDLGRELMGFYYGSTNGNGIAIQNNAEQPPKHQPPVEPPRSSTRAKPEPDLAEKRNQMVRQMCENGNKPTPSEVFAALKKFDKEHMR